MLSRHLGFALAVSLLLVPVQAAHISYIPAGSDLASLRFEQVKPVRSPEAVYEVTYSYRGQPMGSDEYGGTAFTLQVYFQRDELPPVLRQSLAAGRKWNRADTAAWFHVSTWRDTAPARVVDESRSRLCAYSYGYDGEWAQRDPDCTSVVRLHTIAAPTGYIAVRIDAAGEAAAATSAAPPARPAARRP